MRLLSPRVDIAIGKAFLMDTQQGTLNIDDASPFLVLPQLCLHCSSPRMESHLPYVQVSPPTRPDLSQLRLYVPTATAAALLLFLMQDILPPQSKHCAR